MIVAIDQAGHLGRCAEPDLSPILLVDQGDGATGAAAIKGQALLGGVSAGMPLKVTVASLAVAKSQASRWISNGRSGVEPCFSGWELAISPMTTVRRESADVRGSVEGQPEVALLLAESPPSTVGAVMLIPLTSRFQLRGIL
ncbi:TPA: hypothetical protein RQN60_000519 [Aeromonas dhakensis]|nr:hypothetical protein [Aeromonas dhakensis]